MKSISLPSLGLLCFQCFFLSFPLSISLSQSFFVLGFLLLFPSFLQFSEFRSRNFLTFLLLGALYYIGFFRELRNDSEARDFFLLFGIPAGAYFFRVLGNRAFYWISISYFLLVLFGLFSLLFPYRLSSFVTSGFQYTHGQRLPHQLFQIGGIPFFLPLGFQNTHLTYGALLGLTFTFQLFTKKEKLLDWVLFFLGFLLLLLNQSRSIWFGILYCFLFVFLFLQNSKIKSFAWNTKKLLFVIGIIAGTSAILFLLFQYNWLFKRSIEQLFLKQTLENQRLYIHWGNFQLAKGSFPWGIGGGNFPIAHILSFQELVSQFPFLFYEISIVPRSHAHNDLVHAAIVGGCLSFLALFFLFFFLFKKLTTLNRSHLCFIAPGILYLAGFFQCYILDDEVALPFYFLLGGLSIAPVNQKSFLKNRNTTVLLFVLIPLILFFGFYFLQFQTPLQENFQHRAKHLDNHPFPEIQASLNAKEPITWEGSSLVAWKLEGCLQNNFKIPSGFSKREEPVSVSIQFPKTSKVVAYPDTILVQFRARDSFDQDKFYRLQEERVLKTISFPTKGIEEKEIVWEATLESPDSEAQFLDFGFEYRWENSSSHKMLPTVVLWNNCERTK